MAESNANIGVRVGGDITPLQQSLKKGSSLVSNFTKQARSASASIAKIGGAAAASATLLGAISKVSAENARQLKNLANVSNVAVDEFQRLAHGAESVDISMEKFGDILKDVNDRIGDFVATGGGPMADFFENIGPQVGLTIDQFKRLSGPEALQAYYNALEQANLNQQDMTFYLEAIASDATNLIPLLRQNGAGFKAMAAEADNLNVVLSEADIASLEMIDKQFRDMSKSIGAVGDEIALSLNGEIEIFRNFVVDSSKKLIELIKNIASARDEAIAQSKAEQQVNDIIGRRVDRRGRLVGLASQEADEADKLIKRQQELNELIEKASSSGGGRAASAQRKRIKENRDSYVEELEQIEIKLAKLEDESEAAKKVIEIRKGITSELQKQSEIIASSVNAKAVSVSQEIDIDRSDDVDYEQQIADRVAALQQQYLTEEELLRQHRETMMLIGEEYDASQFESESQWLSIRSQAMQDHIAKMTALRENEKTSALNITESLGNSIMQLARGQSKRAFELGKKASIAAAGVKGAQAAVDAWQAGMSTGGPWAPAVAASYTAASLAKTGAIIRSISSQSYGGGGAQPAAPSGGVPQVNTSGAAPNTSSGASDSGQSATFAFNEGYLDAGRVVKMLQQAKDDGITDFNFIIAD